MKKMILALALTSITSFASSMNVAVVDINQVIQNSKQMVTIQRQLEDRFSDQHKKIADDIKAFEAKVAKLNKDSAIMKASDKSKAAKEVALQREQLGRAQAEFQQKVDQARNEALQQLFEKIHGITSGIAAKSKLDLILNKATTPFARDSLDITQQVEKALKQQS